jgi:hypothetical protein
MSKPRKVFLGLGSPIMGNAKDGTCRTKGCTDSVIATICLDCEKKSIQNSLLPMIRLFRIKYGIKIKDAKSLADTVNLLVLGYERRTTPF